MRKRTGLVLAVDVPDEFRAVTLSGQCKDSVDAFKVGIPLIFAAGLDIIRKVSSLGDVISDLKIADIPPISAEIARAAFRAGARAVICHGFPGEDSVRAVVEAAAGEVFVVAEMSHPGGREFTSPVAEAIAKMAVRAGAHGIIAPATRPDRLRTLREIVGNRLILAPGAGAQGGRPADAIRAGADYVIVGRAIAEAPDPAAAARRISAEIAAAQGKP